MDREEGKRVPVVNAMANDIKEFIVQNFLFGQVDEFPGADASLMAAGVIDSTGVLELVVFLESRFEICVEDAELVPSNLDSVTQLAEYVQRKQSDNGA